MNNYGIIIRHLRKLNGLTVQQCALKIGRSKGWLSEVENGRGRCRLAEEEFNRIVERFGAAKQRPMFKTWVANSKNAQLASNIFEGPALRAIRLKKKMTLAFASDAMGTSPSRLSKIETGQLRISRTIRNQILVTYNYSPASFKNYFDRSRGPSISTKAKLLAGLNHLTEEGLQAVLDQVQEFLGRPMSEQRATRLKVF